METGRPTRRYRAIAYQRNTMRRTQKQASPNPVSPKQLAANRANAAQSTGPRTPEGKARSARNSVKHGFTASTFAVVRLEDLQEIAHLKAGLIAAYQPANSQELFALERMAVAQQTIRRAARLEAGLFTTCLNETLDTNDRPFTPMSIELAGDGDIEITRAQNRNYCLAQGFHRLSQQSNSWSLCMRYKVLAERQYRRALEDFDRLKALRPNLPNEALPNERAMTAPLLGGGSPPEMKMGKSLAKINAAGRLVGMGNGLVRERNWPG